MTFAVFVLLAASTTFEESFRAGLLALQRNDLPAAETNLTAAAKLAPGNGRVWVALAQTYRKLNEKAKADEAVQQALKAGGNDPLVLSTLTLYYSESDQILQAAELQTRYAATVPKDNAARDKAEALYFEATQPLLQQQKFAEAIPILTKATAALANSAQLQLALGVACYGMRRFDEAAAAFLRTIAIDPTVEQPYLFLGKFLDQVPARLPEITKQFIQYERANPVSATGPFLHAKALNAQTTEPETARKLLQRSIAIQDTNAAAHFELGVALERLQQFADAAHELERAATLDPAEPATHYRLARMYDRLGKPDAAQAERKLHTKLIEAQQAAR